MDEIWKEERCRFFLLKELGKQPDPQALIPRIARRYALSETPYIVWRFIVRNEAPSDLFWDWTRSLFTSAGERMRRRRPTWEKYLSGRETGVETYAGRTIGIRLEKFENDRTVAENISTLAVTYSHYHQKHLDALSPDQIISDNRLNLPKEKTLKKPVPRHVGSDGWGVVIELRAFSKDEQLKLPPEVQAMALKEGIVTGLQVTYHHPDLAKLPVFQTFGDEHSMLLYGGTVRGRTTEGKLKLGFALNETNTPADRPIVVYGTRWWDLQATPEGLENWLMQQKVVNVPFNTLLSSHNRRLPNGATITIRKGGRFNTELDGAAIDASLLDEAEVGPGIFGKGEVMWEKGHLLLLESLTRPLRYETRHGLVEFPVGSRIYAVEPPKHVSRPEGKEFGRMRDFRCVVLGQAATLQGIAYAAGTILAKTESGRLKQVSADSFDFCMSSLPFWPGSG
jgi:hypothetical protein